MRSLGIFMIPLVMQLTQFVMKIGIRITYDRYNSRMHLYHPLLLRFIWFVYVQIFF